ncbi:hypothetical protein MASR1M32_16540 [Rhodobacter sp.]
MSKPKYPSEKLDQYMLRLPDGMRDRIKAAAEANNRSMNAEIVETLKEKYPAAPPVHVVNDVMARILTFILQEIDDEEAIKEHMHFYADYENIDPAAFSYEFEPGWVTVKYTPKTGARRSLSSEITGNPDDI